MKQEIRTCAWCGKEFVDEFNTRRHWYCSDECREAVNRERYRKAHPIDPSSIRLKGWEYVSGGNNWDDDVQLKCESCGSIITKPVNQVTKHKTLHCPECWADERLKYGSKEKYLEAKRPEWEEAKRRTAERKAEEKEQKRRTVICEVCGKEFKTYNPTRKTCSPECQKRRRNKKNDHRLNKDNIVDSDITLYSLFLRDKGVCYICGCQCDWEDKKTTPSGYTHPGETYPSIDHVLPIARGGKHSWANVRLACIKCNSLKSDKLIDAEPIDNAYEYKRKNVQKKKVRQYLNDELVAEFESTAEAERKTGVKQKGIQKCARGESRTYGGYRWQYS